MDRCWLDGSSGDALHAVLCAAWFNIRWLLRAIATKGLVALLFAFSQLTLCAACIVTAPHTKALATGAPHSAIRAPMPTGYGASGSDKKLDFAGPTQYWIDRVGVRPKTWTG